jgi:hydroxymethylbilane synthase
LAERAFLKTLEGGCSIPAFALAVLEGEEIRLSGGLVSLDGSRIVKTSRSGRRTEAEAIGRELGRSILDNGGKELLLEIRRQQRIDSDTAQEK